MKNLDIIKFLLIMCGYYNNMKFDSWRCEDDPTCWFYEWSGENDNGDVMYGCEPGLPMAIITIINQIKELPIYHNWIFTNMAQKYILDDECRNKNIERERQRELDNAFDSYMRRDLYKWREENNPCPTCKINKHDHWDDIHYNCEACHTYSCKIMRDFGDEFSKRMRELSDKIKNMTESEKSEIFKEMQKTDYLKNYLQKDYIQGIENPDMEEIVED